MTQRDIYDELVAENVRRYELLKAEYNPLTGEGVQKYVHSKRVRIEIPDFAIPVMYVPEPMLKVRLVHDILKAGGIQAYIDKQAKKGTVLDRVDVEHAFRRVRHKHDFLYWAYSCIIIDAKGGGRIRFKLNFAQLTLLDLLESLRLAGLPINVVIDKARQWGGSTLCIFYQFWILAKWDPYHNFSVAAHINSASHTIVSMLTKTIAEYPAWDLRLPDSEKLQMGHADNDLHAYQVKDSKGNTVIPGIIYVGSAENPDSLRSKNIAGAHFSEVGVWPDTPQKRSTDLVADIAGGMLKHRPLSMKVYESTAKTSDDFFHDLYYDARDGVSDSKAIFIGFFKIINDTLSVDDHREFAKWLYDHRESDKCEDGWKSPGKYYWWLWEQGASMESIQWYREEEKSYTKRSQIVNEAPASDDESFQSSGQKVFDFFDVERLARGCRKPVWEGDLISAGRKGADVLKGIRFLQREGGDLKIYEKPDDTPMSNRYVVAVDVGGPNPTSDYSSVRVMDRLMMMPEFGLEGRPNIVAEMHYHTDHDLLAYDAMRLAKWYNNALLVFESNTLETRDRERDTGVDGSQYILDIVGGLYPNLYYRHSKEENIDPGAPKQWGFQTNALTKPKIIDFMREALRDRMWDEPSHTCCAEMQLYQEIDKKLTAPPHKHDDVLMATAILLWVSFKEMDIPHWIEERVSSPREVIEGNNYAKL